LQFDQRQSAGSGRADSQRIDEQFGPEWTDWVKQVGKERRKIRATRCLLKGAETAAATGKPAGFRSFVLQSGRPKPPSLGVRNNFEVNRVLKLPLRVTLRFSVIANTETRPCPIQLSRRQYTPGRGNYGNGLKPRSRRMVAGSPGGVRCCS
jgi:hypothetical protein